jgi:hypothetical protein
VQTATGEVVSLGEYARGYTREMVDVLVRLALHPEVPPAARATCAQAVLDRGHGRPAQPTMVDVTAKHARTDWTRESGYKRRRCCMV